MRYDIFILLLDQKLFEIFFNFLMVFNFIYKWLKRLSRLKIKCFIASPFRFWRFGSWLVVLWGHLAWNIKPSIVLKWLVIWLRQTRSKRLVRFVTSLCGFDLLKILKIQIQTLWLLIFLEALQKVCLVLLDAIYFSLNAFNKSHVIILRYLLIFTLLLLGLAQDSLDLF